MLKYEKEKFIVCEYNIVIDCISMEVLWVFGFKVEIFFLKLLIVLNFKLIIVVLYFLLRIIW